MRFLRVTALAVVTAGLAVGCGGGSGGGAGATRAATPRLKLAAVRQATEAAHSARTAFEIGFDVRGLPGAPQAPMAIAAEGVVDMDAKLAQLTVALPAELGDALPFSGPLEVVVADQTAYLRVPAALSSLAGGKPWVKISAADGQLFGGLGAGADLPNPLDPGLGLKVLDGVSADDVTEVGHETLRGDDTTHYRATFDPSTLATGDAPAEAQPFLESLGDIEPVPFDLWVDAEGRLRTFSLAFDLGKVLAKMFEAFASAMPTASGEAATTVPPEFSMKMTMSFEAWDFGVPVDISVPPADQVGDGSSLLGAAGLG
jgi:hypothetical protein